MTATRGELQAQAAADLGLQSATWRALGTSVQLIVTDDLDHARTTVEQLLDAVDRACSRFRPDSELSTLPPYTWVEVSPLLARLLAAARDAAQTTGGLVDPTVGQALSELGYDRTFTAVAPDGPAVTVRTVPAGWQHVQVDGRRVQVPPGIDLGATAKALAADLAVSRLSSDALLSLGGDIATQGKRPWPVLVADTADPGSTDTTGQVISLTGCLATSSTTARRWTRGGRVVHHLLDPRTGLPVTPHWRTVSVLASSCLQANVASTAAVVLGTGASRWLNDRGLAARLVADDGTMTLTGDWPEEG